MAELLILLLLWTFCCTCTVIFTPKPLAPPPHGLAGPEDHVEEEMGGDMGVATMTLQTEVQENMIMATTSPVETLMSTSTQVSRESEETYPRHLSSCN